MKALDSIWEISGKQMGQRKMFDVNETIGQLSNSHQSALRWFMDHREEERAWPGSTPDGTLLVSKAKGIYKPRWTNYALSVRESLTGSYSDRDPEIRSDGTWSYLYFQENPDPSKRDSQYTNRGMVDCMRDGVPVGVLRQVSGKPSPTYRILGLALVTGWEEGYFVLEGLSPQGHTDAIPARAQVNLLIALHEGAASNEVSQIAENITEGLDRVIASIVRRRGQPEFRKALIEAYSSRCAISGCDAVEALEACHIVPYGGPQTNSVSNGLLLRGDLHTLFDLGLLAVDTSNMTVVIAPSLKSTDYREFSEKTISVPKGMSNMPSLDALHAHGRWAGLL